MKKSLIFILFFAIIFFPNIFCPLKSVHAQSEYARVLNENTVFYSNPDCTIKGFVLPYGYFVKILQIGVESTRVSYMDGIGNLPEKIGYIKTSDLYFFDGDVVCPYPELSITVNSDEVLFADTDMQYPKTVLSAGQSAFLYGELQILGEKFCYVYSNGFIGYVRKSAFSAYLFPEHPIPIILEPLSSATEDSLSEITTSVDQELKLDETLKIVLIVAVCIVCLSLVYLIFKPKSANLKPTSIYDEDEYF